MERRYTKQREQTSPNKTAHLVECFQLLQLWPQRCLPVFILLTHHQALPHLGHGFLHRIGHSKGHSMGTGQAALGSGVLQGV